MSARNQEIKIVGASANNLRSVDLQLPLRAATMVVGVSGSGKSSLLADTLARESNARMKRFLDLAQDHLPTDADVPAFMGPLPAGIHFSQGSFRTSRRTTVATCSGLLGILRQLFLRHGTLISLATGKAVPPPSPESYASWLVHHFRGRIAIWAVPLRFQAGNGLEQIEALRASGLQNAVIRSETDPPKTWIKGKTVVLATFRPLNPTVRHVIEAKIAELAIPQTSLAKLERTLEVAFEAGRGTVIVELLDHQGSFPLLQSERGFAIDSDHHHVHPADPMPYAPPSTALLSFNMPSSERSGACPDCEGLGEALTVSEELLITHPERSLHEGALALWTPKNYRYVNIQHETIEGLVGIRGFDPHKPWEDLPRSAREVVLGGGVEVADRDRSSGRRLGKPRHFEGFRSAILRRYRKGGKITSILSAWVREGPCPACSGSRWSDRARALKVGGHDLAEFLAVPFSTLANPTGLLSRWGEGLGPVAQPILARLRHQIESFEKLGLGHLSGDRCMVTLSEGESRRLRLAGILGVEGEDLNLLLDEPARGLHEEDIAGLDSSIATLKSSHTVILNDHRFSLARAVDHVVEIGPGAGASGGRVVRQGAPRQILGINKHKIIRDRLEIRPRDPSLRMKGGSLYNLENVSCRIPLGRLVAITGVSGSGKSNFVRGLLLPALIQVMGDRIASDGFSTRPGHWRHFSGWEAVQEVLALDQKRPEPNRRSLVATFLDIADPLRRSYAATPEARALDLTASDFGLNAGRGRCSTCLGLGEMHSGQDRFPCPDCGGRRFGEAVQSVRVEGRSMVDLFELPVDELAGQPTGPLTPFSDLFLLLQDLDLGYISLGRRVDQLSGGEVQRLRLAHRLRRTETEGLLLILDEPSAGLHPADIGRLARVLDRVIDAGKNSVILVEHQLDLVRASDWVIDFGPGGGPAGGRVVAQGTPEEVRSQNSPTGRALRRRPGFGGAKSKTRERPARSGVPSLEEARRARRWLQVLLGYEISLPPDEMTTRVGVEVDSLDLTRARPYEILCLDRELAKWFLRATEPLSLQQQQDRLVEVWKKNTTARLWLYPWLHALQTWGTRVPGSEIEAGLDRLERSGLEEREEIEDPLRALVTGPRFQPRSRENNDRSACLRDCLAMGGGVAVLRSQQGRIIASVDGRPMDLERGYVSRTRLSAVHLCRTHSAGCCPACQGGGTLPLLNLDLLISERARAIEADQWLRPEALGILRGTRRATMLPFFRKLSAEGIWEAGRSFSQLGKADRDLLLHGYWSRPGPGSFLKNKKADPKVTASWLRWNGLFRETLEQIDRSKEREWSRTLLASRRSTPCFRCAGTGHDLSSRAVRREGRSMHDWIISSSIGDLCKALGGCKPHDERDRLQAARLLHCLEPLRISHPRASLLEPIGHVTAAATVVRRIIESFTIFPIATENAV